jgi:hypothetical protein
MIKERALSQLESRLEMNEFRLQSLLEITRAITTNQSVEPVSYTHLTLPTK